jgi:phosphate transport system substrate-binding protein
MRYLYACKSILCASFIISGLSVAVDAQTTNDMVDMVSVPPATVKPQTDAEAELGKKVGRVTPTPEILRPTLDPGLVDFQPHQSKKLTGTLHGAASDVAPLLVHTWIDAFQKYYPNVHITAEPPYAGSLGAKELVAGKLQFVVVSRELKPDDLTDFHGRFGYDPLSVPISGGSYRHYGFLDAVVFFVNRDNPIDHLTFAQLDALFSRTNHHGGPVPKTWGDLGVKGELADHLIHLYGIKPWNGFEEFVRQRVLSLPGKRGEWRDDINYDKLVFPIAQRVAADPDGIGYAGLAYVDHPVKVIALSVDANSPPVPPSYSDVAAATYPLSRVIYFNTNRKPGEPLDPVSSEFIRFILSKQGQDIVQKEGFFLPLRHFQTESSLQMIQ